MTGFGQYQAVAVAVKQPRAHRPLQCINPAGYRAVLDLQAPGGWAEPTQTRHRQKITQIVPIDFPFHSPTSSYIAAPIHYSVHFSTEILFFWRIFTYINHNYSEGVGFRWSLVIPRSCRNLELDSETAGLEIRITS